MRSAVVSVRCDQRQRCGRTVQDPGDLAEERADPLRTLRHLDIKELFRQRGNNIARWSLCGGSETAQEGWVNLLIDT